MPRIRVLRVLLCAALSAACPDGTAPPPAVAVTGVSPSNGPLAGGTAVTIAGANFPAAVDSVRVGTGRLGNLVRVSDTRVTGTTQAGGAADAVSGGPRFTAVAAGLELSCGLATGGAACCWGDNHMGQLGVSTATTSQSAVPVQVQGGRSFIAIAVGARHACALTAGGSVYCWGLNNSGQLGISAAAAEGQIGVPLLADGGLQLASITAGGLVTCGVTQGGAAY